MGGRNYKHKDYSGLLKELQKKSKQTKNNDVNIRLEKEDSSFNTNDTNSLTNLQSLLDKEKNLGIDYDLDNLLSSVKNLFELIDLYDKCEEQLEREQQITQDLLHAIEFSNNYKERCKYATQLHYNRNRRRQYKNAVTVLKPLVEFIKREDNKKMLNRLSNILGEARKAKLHTTEKSYSPRILTELGVISNEGNKN